jgi:hypothetical protein
MPVFLTAGWVELARGDRERAAKIAGDAQEVARSRRSSAAVAEALEIRAMAAAGSTETRALLAEAVAAWAEVGNPIGEQRARLALASIDPDPRARASAREADRRLRAMGVRVSPAWRAVGVLASVPDQQGEAVEVRTLGAFSVIRGGRAVTRSEWRSKKARDLLKILVARRGRATPRELLMETLWPEEPPDRTENRLSVAVAVLRGILDPGRTFDAQHFVVTEGRAVRLDMADLWVDVEAFVDDAQRILSNAASGPSEGDVAVLEAVEASYTGDFLEEDVYEDWSAALREQARALYLAVVRRLALSASRAGRTEDLGRRGGSVRGDVRGASLGARGGGARGPGSRPARRAGARAERAFVPVPRRRAPRRVAPLDDDTA